MSENSMQDVRKLIFTRKPGVSEDAIMSAEQALGATFPSQYRHLVMLVNNAEIDDWILYPIQDPQNLKKTFDDIVRNHTWDSHTPKFPAGYISFADDGSGDNLCFKVHGDKRLTKFTCGRMNLGMLK